MEAKDTVMTPEEIKQGCSAYIDHGGGIGFHCHFKPTLRYNDKLYCTRHNPVRLKTISDKRSAEFIERLHQAEQSREDRDDRLRKEGRQAGMREVVDDIVKLMDCRLKSETFAVKVCDYCEAKLKEWEGIK